MPDHPLRRFWISPSCLSVFKITSSIMSILFMLSLSSVDAYHVRRRCWSRLLAVHLEGSSSLSPLTEDETGALSIGGRVCLIFPYWMFLMGWHGVILFSFPVCVVWFFCGSVLTVLLIPSSWSPRSLESDFFFMSCWILPGSYVHVLFSSAVQ
jgi:hypothetical protein